MYVVKILLFVDSPLTRVDVSSILANATEQDLSYYQRDLNKIQNRASTDLQYNVYQNRTQFIKISKEAEKLKSEIQTLQGLMNELSSTLEQTGWSGRTNADDAARRRNNRSSVANLEAMWSTQLQSLWKMIEGSQKFIAAIPGRHVVLEMDGWLELDAATWKPKKPAHLVLLNDHLLVATRKRKRTDAAAAAQGIKAPTKLVAERCWPLAEIDLTDLTAGAKEVRGPFRNQTQITGAVTVRHGDAAYTYRSERPESHGKDELLVAFKRAAEELRRTQRADDENGSGAALTVYRTVTDSTSVPDGGLSRSLSKSQDRSELLIDLEGKQRNLRWVEGQIDELDIEIALQRFDAAVDRVGQLRKLAKSLTSNPVAKDLISVKVDERAGRLAGTMVFCKSRPLLTVFRRDHATPNGQPCPPRTHTGLHCATRTVKLFNSGPTGVPVGTNLDHPDACSCLCFRGQRGLARYGPLRRLLHVDQEYREHLRSMLRSSRNECLHRMGQATARRV